MPTSKLLVARARQRTGLSDFGPAGWQEGFERLVAAVNSDVGDDARAVERIEEIIVGRLVTRLRVEAWYAEHGAEASHPVEGPLIIFGLPRTATTALNHLLALDPRFRYPRSWELADPVPSASGTPDTEDPRRPKQSRQAGLRHIATVDGPAEDGRIYALHFRNAEAVLPVPSYTKWWRTADHTTAFPYHERILRLLHSRRPPHYWLLKFPNYLFHLPEIAAQYPNARFVMTHRDPVAAIPSVCSVMADSRQRRIPHWSTNQATFGRELLAHFAEGMQRTITDRVVVGEDRFIDVSQHEMEIDAVGTAERIYDLAGLDLDDDLRGKMSQWAGENRRGSRGVHYYTTAEFGLTPEDIRAAFSDYLDAFGAFCGQKS
jgi:hypothetical protein